MLGLKWVLITIETKSILILRNSESGSEIAIAPALHKV